MVTKERCSYAERLKVIRFVETLTTHITCSITATDGQILPKGFAKRWVVTFFLKTSCEFVSGRAPKF